MEKNIQSSVNQYKNGLFLVKYKQVHLKKCLYKYIMNLKSILQKSYIRNTDIKRQAIEL